MTQLGIAEAHASAQLNAVVRAYCKSRNLDYPAYMEGLMRRGQPSPAVIEILIRNHQAWLA